MSDIDTLHDAYIAAARDFRAAPSFAAAHEVTAAYRRFFLAFAGQSGVELAVAELRERCAREIAKAAA